MPELCDGGFGRASTAGPSTNPTPRRRSVTIPVRDAGRAHAQPSPAARPPGGARGVHRRHRRGRAAHRDRGPAAPRSGRVAVGDVPREPRRDVRAGGRGDGDPRAPRVLPPPDRDRVLRRADDVLDHAARGAADARRERERAGGGLPRRQHRARAGVRPRRQRARPAVAGVSGVGTWLAVAVAGAIGSVARFGLHETVARRLGQRYAVGTLLVNLSGAFALGLLVGAALTGDAYRIFGTALLGAYTTFSTWMLETERLAGRGLWAA